MKVGVLILALVASTYAAAAESFEIISSEVRGICDTAARESLYKSRYVLQTPIVAKDLMQHLQVFL